MDSDVCAITWSCRLCGTCYRANGLIQIGNDEPIPESLWLGNGRKTPARLVVVNSERIGGTGLPGIECGLCGRRFRPERHHLANEVVPDERGQADPSSGNQAGRARLTDTSNLQQTFYPRGVIFSTGEDTPEGHSVRARMMISAN